MVALLVFIAVTVVVFALLLVLVHWVIERRPRWRSTAAFFIALAAAYSTSFALDLFFGSLLRAYTIKPYVLPVFTWAGYAAGLHWLGRLTAIGPNPIRFAYVLIGGLAVMGGFRGQKHSFLVGFSCLAIALLCFVFPAVGCEQVHRTDPNSATDLMARAFEGNMAAVKALLAKGVAVDSRDNKGHTALMSAALSGKTQIVQLLLDRGAAIDARDNSGRTALIVSALHGHTETVLLLLNRGANFNAADNGGVTALIAASGDGHSDTVDLLLAKKAQVNAETVTGRTALLLAAAHGHTTVVRRLLVSGADVNARANDGTTPLEAASFNGHTEIVRLLRSAGARD